MWVVGFLYEMGLHYLKIDAKNLWLIGFLAQEGAYTSRCQMPVYVFVSKNEYIKSGMVRI